MKKTFCLVLFALLLVGFAACGKKGEIYIEPPTEVVTLEDGETVVYEIVTGGDGAAVTDEQGSTKRVVYDPPVTEKGGYLVTDAQGSTVKQSASTLPGTTVKSEIGVGEIEANGTTAQPETIIVTTPQGETQVVTVTAKPTTPAANTNTNANETGAASADVPTKATSINGSLSKEKAAKLTEILSLENGFEEDLIEGDFKAANSSIVTYIASIDLAVKSIKADKELYAFVGDDNLRMWYGNMVTARQKYMVFMTMVDQAEKTGKKSDLYFSAYIDFQNYYRYSLEAFYTMQTAAERLV